MSAPRSLKGPVVKHLGDADQWEFIALEMKQMNSFKTYGTLQSRGRADYYPGFVFDNPKGLPAPFGDLFRSHGESILYVVFSTGEPLAWYSVRTGWVAPKRETFYGTQHLRDYEKVQNAVLTITGKGGTP